MKRIVYLTAGALLAMLILAPAALAQDRLKALPRGRLLAKAAAVWVAVGAGQQAPPERRGMTDVHHAR